jgi:DNA-binding NarL/FixJ family response regulator
MPFPQGTFAGHREEHLDRTEQKPGAASMRSLDASRPAAMLKTYIVEDSPVIRENLIATLEELVAVQVVGTADNESAAVYWLTQPRNHCDLVIVDIFLKSGSGLGVLSAIKQLADRTKLVVLSNYATPDMRRKCLELGADKVFDKSNESDALITFCQRLAAGDTSASVLGAL